MYETLTAALLLTIHKRSFIFPRQSKESLLEGHIQSSNGSLLVLPGSLQVLDCLPVLQPVAGRTVTVIVSVYAT